MKNKKKKIILTLIIVLVLILIGLLLILKNNSKNGEEPIQTIEVMQEEAIERHLHMNGTGVFFDKYTGDLKTSEITTVLEKIAVNYIPRVYNYTKDYNENELEVFFDNNAKNLKNMIGITDKEEFVKFAQALQKTGVDFDNWDLFDLLRETFVDESDKDGYSYAKFMITFRDKKKVTFDLYVARTNSAEIPYIVGISE